jgi:hypothetical protein
MQNPVKRSTAVLLALAAAAVLVILVAGGVRAGQPVTDYMNSQYYPGRVQAIHFGNNVMDANDSLTWGNWDVGFRPQLPVATSGAVGGSIPGRYVKIPLVCTNSVTGAMACALGVIDGGPRLVCRIDIVNPSTVIQPKCPESLEFAP